MEMEKLKGEVRETAGYLNQKGCQLYYVLHSAPKPVAMALLASPFPIERSTTYAPWVRWARFLAQNGVATLRFDYRGIGESTGEFSEMSVIDWLEDVDLCEQWLRNQYGKLPLVLQGLGFGGLLASNRFQCGLGDALLLWSPLARGDEALERALLRRVSYDLLQDSAGGPKTGVDYLAELDAGRTVAIDGYSVSPRLWRDCKALLPVSSDAATGTRPVQIVKLKHTEVPLVEGVGLWQALNPRARMRRFPLNPDLTTFFSSNLNWITAALHIQT